ncbi:hypothetical protein C2S51_019791 [Perilla frutescens var. frutescens]|nr:hypothetical protein C2S51_019791 [Perilla frutescens var. frutescens]
MGVNSSYLVIGPWLAACPWTTESLVVSHDLASETFVEFALPVIEDFVIRGTSNQFP